MVCGAAWLPLLLLPAGYAQRSGAGLFAGVDPRVTLEAASDAPIRRTALALHTRLNAEMTRHHLKHDVLVAKELDGFPTGAQEHLEGEEIGGNKLPCRHMAAFERESNSGRGTMALT